jgi:hypothetical protein
MSAATFACTGRVAAPVVAKAHAKAPTAFTGARVGSRGMIAKPVVMNKAMKVSGGRSQLAVYAVRDGTPLDRPLRVAVVGGGPSGACAAETLAQGGVETFLIERKMDNCKVRRGPRS